MSKLIILDRDGVINYDSESYIRNPDQWLPIPGSLEAISELTRAGYLIAVATNQSGVARGYFDKAILQKMHRKMQDLVAQKGGRILEICYCPHLPDAGCFCRKPEPGLLLEVAKRLNVSLDGSWMVGDSLKDLQAAQKAGAQPVLVLTGKGQKTQQSLGKNHLVPVYENLLGFSRNLLEQK